LEEDKMLFMRLKQTLLLIIFTAINVTCGHLAKKNSFDTCIKCLNGEYYEWNNYNYISLIDKIDSFLIVNGIIKKGDRYNYLKLFELNLIDSIDKEIFLNSLECDVMDMPHSWSNYFYCAASNQNPKWKNISTLLHVDFEDLFNNRGKQIILLEAITDEEFKNKDIKLLIQKLIYMDIAYRSD